MRLVRSRLKPKHYFLLSLLGVLLILYWNCLPEQLFRSPTSTVLEDKEGGLLGGHIAADEQWRFPEKDSVPEKFAQSILQFEDARFHYHPGVDPFAFSRALWQNLSAGKVVSGGSTISMQVIRLSRKGQPRTILEKMKEMVLATRLELAYSKKEILALYASHAPFGGNVVGLDAASWRYYGKPPEFLTWGQSATLAVLPNAPGLVHPGKDREKLKRKRDRLLDKLEREQVIDSLTCSLSKEEALPGPPEALPSKAPRLLTHLRSKKEGKRIQTTVDPVVQEKVRHIVNKYHRQFEGNGIHNAAALVMEVDSGDVMAYVGNTDGAEENAVDMIQVERSSGSILKPLLFSRMIQKGELLPGMLVPDIPLDINGFSPKNYDRKYRGVVSASQALSMSLNIPAVQLLNQHGISPFHRTLKQAGFESVDRPPGHYGLSLILGGAEVTLWDLAGVYGSMARVLKHYHRDGGGHYQPSDQFAPDLFLDNATGPPLPASKKEVLFKAGAVWSTFNSMLDVSRPETETGWEYFNGNGKVAYKTGTSYGNRDAWAVGITPGHVVAVWVGNADGEGRKGLTGVGAAAPILFDIFRYLGTGSWFTPPADELMETVICRKSGFRAREICPKDTLLSPRSGSRTPLCSFHERIHLGPEGKFRVTSDCETPSRMKHKAWFVLPPLQEYFFKKHQPDYRELPPFRDDCQGRGGNPIALVYPQRRNAELTVPLELGGKKGKIVFEAIHRSGDSKLFWNLDEDYVGQTKNGFHQMGLRPDPGEHVLTLVDEQGNRLEYRFMVDD